MSDSATNTLVLLSGWGCDARIWCPLAPFWPSELEVETPDWPGYADRSPLAYPASLEALADAMAEDLPGDAVWVGWSLGGLLAGALLDYLPAPRALVLLGMGARFPHPEGVSPTALTRFRQAFRRDPVATHAHFMHWQLGGEPSPRAAHRRLRTLLGDEINADAATLTAGLTHLAEIDNTRRLATPPCPVHRLAGEDDPLLAPAVRERADYRLPGAGHCPPISQPMRLTRALAAIAVAPARSLAETSLETMP
ncbi:pimeloyl-[acyl-carrier protein] methyl ester esterase [Chromohalobacter marismortui]|uniref:Pimeloyl-[acyl-carrier protein] methyl ester esterase n=1 Tax=Chromohalobacter marismortui TaxID=42055 RepID=A0A4R7NUJ9_9GAMM|nr:MULTISPECIES: alpha/beta fold hydrolase [Chromohalobacter]MCI0510736.1 alpha/beta fold hydrolase [Chromohalobacter sp.]MCI0594774.1 alpha/beta fold hydrolase [Chromohalobacter sp.]TDU24687.1 pimeloyl-[acyl-carrier protein] methyl ester esterase [Chromohalobacter marismortui]